VKENEKLKTKLNFEALNYMGQLTTSPQMFFLKWWGQERYLKHSSQLRYNFLKVQK
jgi:hypothetical protein